MRGALRVLVCVALGACDGGDAGRGDDLGVPDRDTGLGVPDMGAADTGLGIPDVGVGVPDMGTADTGVGLPDTGLGILDVGAADMGTPPSVSPCDAPTWLDALAGADWLELKVAPTGGTAAIRAALRTARDQHPGRAVRIVLAPGVYADTLGADLYETRLLRTATTPIHLVAEDPRPNATVLETGLNLVGVAYLAVEGLTFGPATLGTFRCTDPADPESCSHDAPKPASIQAGIHISGAARDGTRPARVNGVIDYGVLGDYEPSHHLLVRDVVVQNAHSDQAASGVLDEGAGTDGIKFNQCADVIVQRSTITQVSRHGIDNVGVHRALFCDNVITHVGQGLGLEAKGGSVDVLYEGNVFHDVRRVMLGGEWTDVAYYFPEVPGQYTHEAARVVARNNVIVDPREAAIEFTGCADCSAVGNTILFTPAFEVGASGQEGDAIRVVDSGLYGSGNAGDECISWDPVAMDYVGVDPCWGVGSHGTPELDARPLRSADLRFDNNLVLVASAHQRALPGQNTTPCPLNPLVPDVFSRIGFDGNYWWNGGYRFPTYDEGCPELPEGVHSTYSVTVAAAAPLVASTSPTLTALLDVRAAVLTAVRPSGSSPFVGAGAPDARARPIDDAASVPRPSPPTIGAREP